MKNLLTKASKLLLTKGYKLSSDGWSAIGRGQNRYFAYAKLQGTVDCAVTCSILSSRQFIIEVLFSHCVIDDYV